MGHRTPVKPGSQQQRKAAAACEAWNAKHPVGTVVEYRSIITKEFSSSPTIHRTRSEAFPAGTGYPVIFLEAKAGYVSLDHVKARASSPAT